MEKIDNQMSALPVMMYIHGFRSGANGSKRRQLAERFEGKFRVIAPEVDADPEKSLAKLNEIISREKPAIVIGTSLGGWMTAMCDSGDAKLIIVNPSTRPEESLGKWEGQELPYFCQRLDGQQTYTLTKEVLDKYKAYDFAEEVKKKGKHLYALCSTADELLGDSHIKVLQPILPEGHLTIVDDFGHRCDGKGMTHLFKIIEEEIN